MARSLIITSVDNARVKSARALRRPKGRREQGACLVEGPRAVETALDAGATVTRLFVTPRFAATPKGSALLDKAAAVGVAPTRAEAHVLERLSDTRSPQGVVAVVRMQDVARDALAESFRDVPALVVADGISDPGNLGAVVRSAAATGAGVWTSAGSTDLYDPKAVRASAGGLFAVCHAQRVPGERIAEEVGKGGRRLVVADARGGQRYDAFDWRAPFALVIGNEAHGPDVRLLAAADAVVRVPLAPPIESLNAAVTASICLFEAARQRDFQGM